MKAKKVCFALGAIQRAIRKTESSPSRQKTAKSVQVNHECVSATYAEVLAGVGMTGMGAISKAIGQQMESKSTAGLMKG
jgi:hypothetical protein